LTDRTGPVLAIDFGLRRTGLALSDPERILASGVPTFVQAPGRSLRRTLREVHEQHRLSGVVLGVPQRDDGSVGGPAAEILALGKWIEQELGLPVAYLDESLTTLEAGRLLRDAPKRVRRDRAKRDEMAARILLQEFLDGGCRFENHPRPGNPPEESGT
jgi:putative Holliday junction resolvase